MADMNKLYDLAYRFRNSGIWTQVYEDELFAVKLPSATAYCCIMGRGGGHMAVSVYIGEEAFSTFFDLLQPPEEEFDILRQDCIQCSMEKRDMLKDEEIAEIRSYCKKSGMPFRSPYPQFTRYRPYCLPWSVTEDSDWEALSSVLQAVTLMDEVLRIKGKKALGLKPVLSCSESTMPEPVQIGMFDEVQTDHVDETKDLPGIPLFSIGEEGLQTERIPLPEKRSIWRAPDRIDGKKIAGLEKQKQQGVYECEVIRLAEPVDGEPPYIPSVLMTVEAKAEGKVLTPVIAKGALYDPNALLHDFTEMLVKEEVYPKRIKVRTEETRVLLEPLCKEAKIWLDITEKMVLLNDTIDEILNGMEMGIDDDINKEDMEESIEDIVEMLDDLSVDQIRMLPEFILRYLLQSKDLLPPRIAAKVRKALK